MSEPPSVIRYHWHAAQHFQRGRSGPIRSIILHATEGHLKGDLATLISGDGRSVSVHWYVTRTGEYYHFVQDADTANHAGAVIIPQCRNAESIGIEQEGIPAKEPWPQVQIQATANLVAFILQKHGSLEIYSHKACAPSRKTDPEPYPWDEFHSFLELAKHKTWSAEQVNS